MFTAINRKRAMITLTTFKSLEHNTTLFDFDTPINEDNFIINDTSHIYRKKINDDLSYKNLAVVTKEKAMNGDLPDFDFQKIFGLNVKHEEKDMGYVIEGNWAEKRRTERYGIDELEKMPFICINNKGRTKEVKSTVITEGDYLKMGRSYFKVVQTHLSRGKNSHLPEEDQPLELPNVSNARQTKTCRICLMEDIEDMISPCKCKGSCESVHVSCLMLWLQSKVTRQDSSRLISTYNLSKFECELCKHPLPNKILVENREISFVEFVYPEEPYLILEKLEQNARDRTLYIVTPKDQLVRIGRGNYCDIRLTDPTVSRTHCHVEFRNGQFHIWDMGSKYGTLTLLQNSQQLTRSLCIQLSNRIYKWQVMPSIHNRTYNYL